MSDSQGDTGSGSVGSTSDTEGDTGETEGSATEGMSEAQLVIPMAPLDGFTMTPVFDPPDFSEDLTSATMRESLSVDLALGGDYPEIVEAVVGSLWISECGNGFDTGLELTEVSVDDSGLEVSLSGAVSLNLEPQGEGDFMVAIRGVLATGLLGGCAEEFGGLDVVDVELDLEVKVRRPEGVVLDLPFECRDEEVALVEPSARLHWLASHLIDVPVRRRAS